MPKTLLLADDSVTIQKVVGISFANEDVSITTVDNGDDAIAKARELRPDVILADVVMPGKSGYEVCEAVKADTGLRHIPVLLLTGTFEAFDEERAARAGAAGHVAKPFEAQTLVDRVKELLAEATAAPPPSPAPGPAPPQSAPGVAEAPTNPELGASDNAFDFFDDNSGELSEDLPSAAADEADALDLDEPDTAFAFGEDDLGAVTQEPAPAPPLHGREAAPDATVAILPEDEDAAAAEDDGALDFAFDGPDGPDGLAPERAPVENDDLAHATLLDPAAGSGFDVSSSDLAREEAAPAPPEPPIPSPTRILEPPAATSPPAADPAPGPQPLPRDPVMDRLVPERAAAPPAPEAPAPAAAPPRAASSPAANPAAGWEAEPPAAIPRPFGAEDEPDTAHLAELESAEEASVWPEEPDDLDDAEPLELEPEPDVPPVASRPATAPAGGAAGATTPLSPAMREELNATLEKIAWDAFGQVTEKIVAEALERIEQVAWEVIPKLAETLIQEEIRRLRDESTE